MSRLILLVLPIVSMLGIAAGSVKLALSLDPSIESGYIESLTSLGIKHPEFQPLVESTIGSAKANAHLVSSLQQVFWALALLSSGTALLLALGARAVRREAQPTVPADVLAAPSGRQGRG